MDLFDEEWLRSANATVATFVYEIDGGFSFNLRVNLVDASGHEVGRSTYMVINKNRLSFFAEAGQPDAEAWLTERMVRETLFKGAEPMLVADAFDTGVVRLVGDFSRLRLFAGGILRGRSSELSEQLSSL